MFLSLFKRCEDPLPDAWAQVAVFAFTVLLMQPLPALFLLAAYMQTVAAFCRLPNQVMPSPERALTRCLGHAFQQAMSTFTSTNLISGRSGTSAELPLSGSQRCSRGKAMAPITPQVCTKVDPKKKPWEQSPPLHNRWHPDIPPVSTVQEGQVFRVETSDWTGGQIKDDDSAQDMKDIDLTRVHNLSGPIRIEGKDGKPAMPGDLLAIEILDLGALEGDEWGFTGCFDRENGGSFLVDHFPNACKAIWQFEGIWASSRHIPGVRFAGMIHPGLIGTAPSHELLAIWNKRERALVEEGEKARTLCAHLATRPLALLPEPQGACLGMLKEGSEDFKRVAAQAARTIPGREHGGNVDIKHLTRGCKVYFPVFLEGANLSMGDMHFSQGDGEVSFCGGIEMSGFLHLKAEILRGGMDQYLTPMGPSKLNVMPIFEISPLEARYSEWLVFEGISIDEQGKQHFLDASIAYKRAVLDCINYLHKFGYTKEQVYLLLSCCPCEGKIAAIVDVPNACCTIAIPTAIFDQDIRPKAGGPPTGPKLLKRDQLPTVKYEGKLPTTQIDPK